MRGTAHDDDGQNQIMRTLPTSPSSSLSSLSSSSLVSPCPEESLSNRRRKRFLSCRRWATSSVVLLVFWCLVVAPKDPSWQKTWSSQAFQQQQKLTVRHRLLGHHDKTAGIRTNSLTSRPQSRYVTRTAAAIQEQRGQRASLVITSLWGAAAMSPKTTIDDDDNDDNVEDDKEAERDEQSQQQEQFAQTDDPSPPEIKDPSSLENEPQQVEGDGHDDAIMVDPELDELNEFSAHIDQILKDAASKDNQATTIKSSSSTSSTSTPHTHLQKRAEIVKTKKRLLQQQKEQKIQQQPLKQQNPLDRLGELRHELDALEESLDQMEQAVSRSNKDRNINNDSKNLAAHNDNNNHQNETANSSNQEEEEEDSLLVGVTGRRGNGGDGGDGQEVVLGSEEEGQVQVLERTPTAVTPARLRTPPSLTTNTNTTTTTTLLPKSKSPLHSSWGYPSERYRSLSTTTEAVVVAAAAKEDSKRTTPHPPHVPPSQDVLQQAAAAQQQAQQRQEPPRQQPRSFSGVGRLRSPPSLSMGFDELWQDVTSWPGVIEEKEAPAPPTNKKKKTLLPFALDDGDNNNKPPLSKLLGGGANDNNSTNSKQDKKEQNQQQQAAPWQQLFGGVVGGGSKWVNDGDKKKKTASDAKQSSSLLSKFPSMSKFLGGGDDDDANVKAQSPSRDTTTTNNNQKKKNPKIPTFAVTKESSSVDNANAEDPPLPLPTAPFLSGIGIRSNSGRGEVSESVAQFLKEDGEKKTKESQATIDGESTLSTTMKDQDGDKNRHGSNPLTTSPPSMQQEEQQQIPMDQLARELSSFGSNQDDSSDPSPSVWGPQTGAGSTTSSRTSTPPVAGVADVSSSTITASSNTFNMEEFASALSASGSNQEDSSDPSPPFWGPTAGTSTVGSVPETILTTHPWSSSSSSNKENETRELPPPPPFGGPSAGTSTIGTVPGTTLTTPPWVSSSNVDNETRELPPPPPFGGPSTGTSPMRGVSKTTSTTPPWGTGSNVLNETNEPVVEGKKEKGPSATEESLTSASSGISPPATGSSSLTMEQSAHNLSAFGGDQESSADPCPPLAGPATTLTTTGVSTAASSETTSTTPQWGGGNSSKDKEPVEVQDQEKSPSAATEEIETTAASSTSTAASSGSPMDQFANELSSMGRNQDDSTDPSPPPPSTGISSASASDGEIWAPQLQEQQHGEEKSTGGDKIADTITGREGGSNDVDDNGLVNRWSHSEMAREDPELAWLDEQQQMVDDFILDGLPGHESDSEAGEAGTTVDTSPPGKLPDRYEMVMHWAQHSRVTPTMNQLLFLLRCQKVAATAIYGQSRWGPLENQRSCAIAAAMWDEEEDEDEMDHGSKSTSTTIASVVGQQPDDSSAIASVAAPVAGGKAEESTATTATTRDRPSRDIPSLVPPPPVPPSAPMEMKKALSLFDLRNVKVASSSSVGKSRWGESENRKALAMGVLSSSAPERRPQPILKKMRTAASVEHGVKTLSRIQNSR